MAEIIPTYNWTDFLKVVKAGKVKELCCCEINFNGEYMFTFINPATDFLRHSAEQAGILSNSIGGKTLEELLQEVPV